MALKTIFSKSRHAPTNNTLIIALSLDYSYSIVRGLVAVGAIGRLLFTWGDFRIQSLLIVYILASLGLAIHATISIILALRARNTSEVRYYPQELYIDTILFSALYFSIGSIASDLFLFYFLPLLTVADQRYRHIRRHFFAFVSVAFIFTTFLISLVTQPYPPLEVLIRDVLPRLTLLGLALYIAYHQQDVLSDQAQVLESRREELEAVHQTAIYISEKKDKIERLEAIVDAAIELLQAKGCKLYLPTPDKTSLRLVKVKGTNTENIHEGMEIPLTAGMAGLVVRTGTPQLTNNYKEYEHRIDELQDTFEALIEVPLLFGDEVVGVLGVFDDWRTRQFDTHDTEVLVRLARHAAVAIHEVELFEEATHKTNILESLSRASNAVNANLNIEDTLKAIAEHMYKLATVFNDKPPIFSCVATIDKQDDSLSFRATYPTSTIDDLVAELPKIDLSANKSGLVSRCCKEKEILIFGDAPQEEDFIEFNSLTNSQVVVPLFRSQEVIGVISIEHADKYAFSDNIEEHMKLLASMSTVALDSAELFADRTALAIHGLSRSAPRHESANKAVAIQDRVPGILKILETISEGRSQSISSDELRYILNDLNEIDDIVEEIININDPNIPELDYEEVEPVRIVEWLGCVDISA